MRKTILFCALWLLCFELFSANKYWVTATPGVWSATANWSNASGGASGATIPGAGDVAIFDGAGGRNGKCTLDIAPSVGGMTMNGYTGTLDLAGFTISIAGNITLATGTVINSGGSASVALNAATSTTFSGTTFSADITGSTGTVLFNGSTFNNPVAVTKTNAANDTSNGNNTFSNTLSLTNGGTGGLRMANTTRDIYNGAVTLTVSNTGNISMAYTATGNQFNDNIDLVYTTATAIGFGSNGGTSTLASGKTFASITAGGSGCGGLNLVRFTQAGATAQNISLTGNSTATLTLGPSTSFAGNVNFVAPSIALNGATYSGTAYLEKTGTNNDTGTGGNTFAQGATLVNSGTGNLTSANTTADIFSSNLNLTINNSGGLYMATAATGTQFNGNISVTYNATGSVVFGNTGTATSTLAAGQTISVSSPGASGSGNLKFAHFTQSGATAQNFGLITNPSATLTIGAGSTFNAALTISAPSVILQSSTFQGTMTMTKLVAGNVDDAIRGGNTFNGTFTANNQSANDMYFGGVTGDPGDTWSATAPATFNSTGGGRIRIAAQTSGSVFNNTATLNVTAAADIASRIQVARFSPGSCTFNGAVVMNNAGNASDMQIAYDPGTTVTFNGPVTCISNTNTTAGSFVIGQDGIVAINNNITFNSLCADNIQIVGGAGTATLGSGFSMSVGASGFAQGQLSFTSFTQNGSTPQSLTLTGTARMNFLTGAIFNGNVNFVAPQIYLSGTTFNGTAYIEKDGATGNTGAGGNTFASTTTIVSSGSGQLALANTSPDTFNGDLTINNTGSSNILLANVAAGNQFNGNVIVSESNPGTGIYFGNSGGTSTMAATKTISIGAGGYGAGVLDIVRFTQNGSAAMSLTLTGTSTLQVGPSSTIGGNAIFIAPRILLHGATYNGTAYIEKNGGTNDNGNGGNTFSGTTTLVNSGSAYLLTANSTADTFNGDVTLTNTGSSLIHVAYNVPGTQWNGNIIVNTTGGTGITFSGAVSGASTLASGKTISVGATGFNTGQLNLFRFTQSGTTAQNLTLTGTASLVLGPSSTFNGNVNFVSPQMYLNGTTYNGTAYLEKNGNTSNSGNGGNTFNGTSTLVCSGSGYFMTGNTTPDLFVGDATLTNTGSQAIYIGNNSAGNQFNGNIIVNSTGGLGIYFDANAAGTTTLASGKTISVGATGFTFGELKLTRFTQLGATPQAITLTNVALLRSGPSSTFNGNVNFVAPQVLMDGATYAGTAYLEKNGGTNNLGVGNNVFNSTATIVNSGSAQFRTNGGNTFSGATTLSNSGSSDLLLELTTGSTYGGDVTMTNTGSANIRAAYAGANAFNGNIIVNSTSGTGITFAELVSATVTLADTKTISVGGTGFTFGTLSLPRFTQVGTTPQTLTLTNVGVLTVGPSSTFNGNVVFTTPTINLNGCVYNGTAVISKTGSTSDTSNGGNTFASTASFNNSGTGYFRNAGGALDTFDGDVTLTNTGTSEIDMSHTTSGTTFNGNIIVNCTNGIGIYFGNNGGTSSMVNGKTISVGGSGFATGELRFYKFTQLGGTAQNLTLTGNASLRIGNASVFNGNVTFLSPQVYLDGATYNGTASITKDGATNNTGTGGNTFASTTLLTNAAASSGQLRTNGNNTFNGATTIVNNAPADLLLELTSGSTYNDVTFTNTGTSYVRVAYIGGNTFNGNIAVNSTGGTGVYFCENPAGTATLANGKTIVVGATGFTAGELRLQRFTQTGGTAQNLVLTSNAIFRTGPASTWGGAITVNSPQLYLDGTVFNGVGNFTKTGTTTDPSAGGNTFNAAVTFTNTNIGIFRLANTTGDVFGSASTYNQNSGTIQPTYAAASTYAGSITVNSASSMIFGTGSAAGTMTFNGSGVVQNISITGVAVPTFNRMTMNTTGGGSVNLNTIVNVGVSALFTTGVMTTSSTNYLNFVNGAVANGASNASYVDGPVKKVGSQPFVYPVGTGGIYRSIAISAPTVATDAFTAQFFRGAQAFGNDLTYSSPIVTVSSCEYWVLTKNAGASSVAVTLSWNSPDCAGPYITDPTTLIVGRWNGANWVSQGNGGTSGNSTTGTIVSSAAMASFGPFALASSSLVNPLPITLTYFEAAWDNGVAKLRWETESELNNEYYTLEKSADGAKFSEIATVKGAGTKNSATDYSYEDESPLAGVSYYRLKQTDFDGHSVYLSVAELINKGEGFVFRIYPNPIAKDGTVQSNFSGSASVISMMGQLLFTVEDASRIGTTGLASGVYIIKTQTGQVQRLVVN